MQKDEFASCKYKKAARFLSSRVFLRFGGGLPRCFKNPLFYSCIVYASGMPDMCP
jgi:hypothetical protein